MRSELVEVVVAGMDLQPATNAWAWAIPEFAAAETVPWKMARFASGALMVTLGLP